MTARPAPLHPTFTASLQAAAIRPATIKQYDSYVRRIASWEAAQEASHPAPAPDHPSPEAVVDFIRQHVTAITPTGTVTSFRAFGNRYLAWAVYVIPDGQLLPARRRHKQHHFRESLTIDDLHRWSAVVLDAELPRYTSTILRLLPIMGLRISEACQLRWEGLSEKPIPTWRFSEKGGAAVSMLVVSRAWAIVAAYREWAASQGQDVARGYVFPGMFPGTHVTPNAVRYHVRRLTPLAELTKPLSPHVLRHTAATLMLEAGESLATVQAFLRHSNIKTTALYAHTTQATQQRAMDKLGEIAEGDSG